MKKAFFALAIVALGVLGNISCSEKRTNVYIMKPDTIVVECPKDPCEHEPKCDKK